MRVGVYKAGDEHAVRKVVDVGAPVLRRQLGGFSAPCYAIVLEDDCAVFYPAERVERNPVLRNVVFIGD
jgi:hypothetical protein